MLARARFRLCIPGMIKRVLLAVTALLGFCFSTSAQVTETLPEKGTTSFSLEQPVTGGFAQAENAAGQGKSFRVLNSAWYGPQPLALDGSRFSFPSAFAWVEAQPVDYLPDFMAGALPPLTPIATRSQISRAELRAVDPISKLDYVGGEVGFFYGSGSGRSKAEAIGGYLRSTIIEGDTQISFGTSYYQSSGRSRRAIGW